MNFIPLNLMNNILKQNILSFELQSLWKNAWEWTQKENSVSLPTLSDN